MEHTKGPWRSEAVAVHEANGPEARAFVWGEYEPWALAECEGWADDSHDPEANAARIVACVNAFPDSTPTSAIEALGEGGVGEMVKALQAAGRALRIHTFQPSGHETSKARDRCGICGKNFRDDGHLRAAEGHTSDVKAEAIKSIRAILSKFPEGARFSLSRSEKGSPDA